MRVCHCAIHLVSDQCTGDRISLVLSPLLIAITDDLLCSLLVICRCWPGMSDYIRDSVLAAYPALCHPASEPSPAPSNANIIYYILYQCQ